MVLTLTAKQEAALKSKGAWPTWEQFVQAVQALANDPTVQLVAQILLTRLLGKGEPKQVTQAACPTPCPDDACQCCGCATHQAGLALVASSKCHCDKSCDRCACCCEAGHHYLKAACCCFAHCCHDSNC